MKYYHTPNDTHDIYHIVHGLEWITLSQSLEPLAPGFENPVERREVYGTYAMDIVRQAEKIGHLQRITRTQFLAKLNQWLANTTIINAVTNE